MINQCARPRPSLLHERQHGSGSLAQQQRGTAVIGLHHPHAWRGRPAAVPSFQGDREYISQEGHPVWRSLTLDAPGQLASSRTGGPSEPPAWRQGQPALTKALLHTEVQKCYVSGQPLPKYVGCVWGVHKGGARTGWSLRATATLQPGELTLISHPLALQRGPAGALPPLRALAQQLEQAAWGGAERQALQLLLGSGPKAAEHEEATLDLVTWQVTSVPRPDPAAQVADPYPATLRFRPLPPLPTPKPPPPPRRGSDAIAPPRKLDTSGPQLLAALRRRAHAELCADAATTASLGGAIAPGKPLSQLPASLLGLWPEAALIKHSCTPNSSLCFMDSVQPLVAADDDKGAEAGQASAVTMVRAAATIYPGDAVTANLLAEGALAPLEVREQLLKSRYGVRCQCARCALERTHDLTLRFYHQDASSELQRLRSRVEAACAAAAAAETLAAPPNTVNSSGSASSQELQQLDLELMEHTSRLEAVCEQLCLDSQQAAWVQASSFEAYQLLARCRLALAPTSAKALRALQRCVELLGAASPGSAQHTQAAALLAVLAQGAPRAAGAISSSSSSSVPGTAAATAASLCFHAHKLRYGPLGPEALAQLTRAGSRAAARSLTGATGAAALVLRAADGEAAGRDVGDASARLLEAWRAAGLLHEGAAAAAIVAGGALEQQAEAARPAAADRASVPKAQQGGQRQASQPRQAGGAPQGEEAATDAGGSRSRGDEGEAVSLDGLPLSMFPSLRQAASTTAARPSQRRGAQKRKRRPVAS